MKTLTVLLLILSSAIAGYVIAHYNQSAFRLYQLEGLYGKLLVDPTERQTSSLTLEMNDVLDSAQYISNEKPRNAFKKSLVQKILRFWEKNNSLPLSGLLRYTYRNQLKKIWVQIHSFSYEAKTNHLTVHLAKIAPLFATEKFSAGQRAYTDESLAHIENPCLIVPSIG